MMPMPPLAVSLGDPAGVGPELVLKAWQAREVNALAPFLVAGGMRVLQQASDGLGLGLPVIPIETVEEAAEAFAKGVPVLGTDSGEWRPGEPCSDGARIALHSLTFATDIVRDGQASALVTGPIAKSHLAKVGFTQPGQTEFIADACGISHDDAVMMLAGPSLRTVPLTIHVALSEVPSLISRDLIERKARIVINALKRDFGLEAPRIAITGLNPHAGEDGRMGSEDSDIIAPAIAALAHEGLAVTGPHPADALFAAHERAKFDVALCMYHDQALIPIKTLDFDQGVNVTLGLPIVRTSPDHGTAFGIAGKGIASAGATIAAIRMAGDCAARRMAAA